MPFLIPWRTLKIFSKICNRADTVQIIKSHPTGRFIYWKKHEKRVH